MKFPEKKILLSRGVSLIEVEVVTQPDDAGDFVVKSNLKISPELYVGMVGKKVFNIWIGEKDKENYAAKLVSVEREQDRREGTRFPYNEFISIYIQGEQTVCIGENVSTGGICIRYSRQLEEGEMIQVCLQDLVLETTVIWSRPGKDSFLAGLKFIPNGDKAQQLESFINHLKNNQNR